MKYLQEVMADYIKPFMYDQQNNIQKVKESEESASVTPKEKGDFDYKNYPPQIVDSSERIAETSIKILNQIDTELAENFKNQKVLTNKLDGIEKEIHKRKELYEICSALYRDQTSEVEKYSKKMKKYNESINHHEEVLASWQCLINDVRKLSNEWD